jgi:hypothetical protein
MRGELYPVGLACGSREALYLESLLAVSNLDSELWCCLCLKPQRMLNQVLASHVKALVKLFFLEEFLPVPPRS